VIETEASRDHTEKMLACFGAKITQREPHGAHGRRITLDGPARTLPQRDCGAGGSVLGGIPDWLPALIVPGSEIVIRSVMMNPLRTGLIADIAGDGRAYRGTRPARAKAARRSRICASGIPRWRASMCRRARAPSMIDEYPGACGCGGLSPPGRRGCTASRNCA